MAGTRHSTTSTDNKGERQETDVKDGKERSRSERQTRGGNGRSGGGDTKTGGSTGGRCSIIRGVKKGGGGW